jgi:MFS family permease
VRFDIPVLVREAAGCGMIDAMKDRRLLYAGAFLRSLATGMIGVLLGVHLAKMGFDPVEIGYVISAGLAGAALAALSVTLFGDRFGRRRSLLALSLLTAGGGLLFAFMDHPLPAAAAAFLGMVNGMGRDRGAFLILDQAILPATVPDEERTRTFAWYNVLQDGGGALGGLLAGTPVALRLLTGAGELTTLRWSVALYASLYLGAAALYICLSKGVEMRRRTIAPAPAGAQHASTHTGAEARLSPASRRILWKISSLFAIDSLAGGLLTTAILSFFFFQRFGADEAVLGPLFFFARAANTASHLGAAWLARRFGLVNTMVFTHIPANLMLIAVAYAPGFPIAAGLFILREAFVEMDVPTRQSYLMAVVRPEERTLAAGISNLVRVSAWAIGPTFAGLFMRGFSLMTPLVIGSGMKVAYDLLLFAAFRRIKPPEERDDRDSP